jgi:hypothetical protein
MYQNELRRSFVGPAWRFRPTPYLIAPKALKGQQLACINRGPLRPAMARVQWSTITDSRVRHRAYIVQLSATVDICFPLTGQNPDATFTHLPRGVWTAWMGGGWSVRLCVLFLFLFYGTPVDSGHCTRCLSTQSFPRLMPCFRSIRANSRADTRGCCPMISYARTSLPSAFWTPPEART